jgi:hypothetical protein
VDHVVVELYGEVALGHFARSPLSTCSTVCHVEGRENRIENQAGVKAVNSGDSGSPELAVDGQQRSPAVNCGQLRTSQSIELRIRRWGVRLPPSALTEDEGPAHRPSSEGTYQERKA